MKKLFLVPRLNANALHLSAEVLAKIREQVEGDSPVVVIPHGYDALFEDVGKVFVARPGSEPKQK